MSFGYITQRLIEQQIFFDEVKSEKAKIAEQKVFELIDVLAKSVKGEGDIHEDKVRYEKKLAEWFKRKIRYNRDATTIVSLLKTQEMQCFSGTMLQQILWRKRGANSFVSDHAVVLFTEGHVQSGYMTETKDGWHLWGIEAVVEGHGKRDFGLVSELSLPIVVVDAELFAVFQLYRNRLANEREVSKLIVQKTAEKYGIDLKKTAVPQSLESNKLSWEANATPFSFGVPKTSAGSFQRNVVDILNDKVEGPSLQNPVVIERGVKKASLSAAQKDISINLKKRAGGVLSQDHYYLEIDIKNRGVFSLLVPFANLYLPAEKIAVLPENLLPLEVSDVEYKDAQNGTPFTITAHVITSTGEQAILKWMDKGNGEFETLVAAGGFLGEVP